MGTIHHPIIANSLLTSENVHLKGVFRTLSNSFQPLTIFAKRSILDTLQGSEYTSVHHTIPILETCQVF